jgi:hypothetical protein
MWHARRTRGIARAIGLLVLLAAALPAAASAATPTPGTILGTGL